MVLEQGGGELFVPVDKAQARGIRALLDKSEIPKLLDRLQQATRPAEGWKERNRDNLRLFNSGSAFDLAGIVESLSELRKTKVLSPEDSLTLQRARKVLICEISEVMETTRSAAEEKIDRALQGRTGKKRAEAKRRAIGPK